MIFQMKKKSQIVEIKKYTITEQIKQEVENLIDQIPKKHYIITESQIKKLVK